MPAASRDILPGLYAAFASVVLFVLAMLNLFVVDMFSKVHRGL